MWGQKSSDIMYEWSPTIKNATFDISKNILGLVHLLNQMDKWEYLWGPIIEKKIGTGLVFCHSFSFFIVYVQRNFPVKQIIGTMVRKYLSTYLLLSMGPSINDVASLEGGRGAKLRIWGNMRGVGVKENPISSIQDWQIMIFFEMYFNFDVLKLILWI